MVFQYAALVDAQFDDRSDVVGFGDNLRFDVRFFHKVDVVGLGQAGGVEHIDHVAIGEVRLVLHVGHGGYHVHIELTLKTFLHYLHV